MKIRPLIKHFSTALVAFCACAHVACFPAYAHDDGKGHPAMPGPGGSAHPGPYTAQNITLLGHLSLGDLTPNLVPNDIIGSAIWGWADPLTKREYALYGLSTHTAIVDVTTPTAPSLIGVLPTQTGPSIWRELRTYNNHLYVVSDVNGNHGMQVFDLTQLRNFSTPPATPVTFSPNFVYNGVASTHTLFINEQTGWAYLNGTNTFGGGLHFVNLADPTLPQAGGGWSQDGYSHDSYVTVYNGPDTQYAGREIAIGFNEGRGISIVDVTNKSSPQRLGQANHSDVGYTHQGWLTEDQQYLLVNDELDELNGAGNMRTVVYDVRNLAAPRYVGAYVHPTRTVDHNLFIRGNYVFESNYSTGLQVFDISQIGSAVDGSLSMQQAFALWGSFDTYPANNDLNFDGQWGNYPFLPSGNVLLGDRQNGLFIVSSPFSTSSVAPEPASVLLLGGVGAIFWVARSRKNARRE